MVDHMSPPLHLLGVRTTIHPALAMHALGHLIHKFTPIGGEAEKRKELTGRAATAGLLGQVSRCVPRVKA